MMKPSGADASSVSRRQGINSPTFAHVGSKPGIKRMVATKIRSWVTRVTIAAVSNFAVVQIFTPWGSVVLGAGCPPCTH